MVDTKPPGDKTLSVPTKTLTLKPRVEQGTVRQSFSHGRTKQVVLEKRSLRRAAPDAATSTAKRTPTKTLTLKPRVEQGTVRQSSSHDRTKQVVAEKRDLSRVAIDSETPLAASAGNAAPAVAQANELFAKILERYPTQGISASSFGKYDAFREWLASEVSLSDWRKDTYATGASTTAHNFGSRWSQSNQVSGRHVPLGIGFVQVRENDPSQQQEAIKSIVKSVKDTSLKFVDGSRPTSYDSIAIFSQLNNDPKISLQGILSVGGSKIGARLKDLFPAAAYTEVQRVTELPDEKSPDAGQNVLHPSSSTDLSVELPSMAQANFAAANFHVSEGLIKRAVASLVSKPFLILAGLSGSGKTQLAIALARWFSSSDLQKQIVAVGADWTSNQNLVGYPDALSDNKYISTPTLDLILRAVANPTLPFFLILDEMNLSHVERYFSDILSALESGERIHLHGSGDKRDIPASVQMPRNLFILGTVNVDETTYMFSPKVLDRANVIEFEVGRDTFASYLNAPKMIDFSVIDGRGEAFALALVEQATTDTASFTPEDRARFQAELLLLFDVFDREGFPFAFRTAKEVYRFVEAFKYLSKDERAMMEAIDAQILQRLMPKLHGDRGRLKKILMALGVLCAAKHIWNDGALNAPELLGSTHAAANSLGEEAPKEWAELISDTSNPAQMPLSLSKILRMLARLRRDGFTTFIEA